MNPNGPVSRSGNLVIFQIQELVTRHIIGKDIGAFSLQHSREYNAMKYNVVFSNEVNQSGIFVLPPCFPTAFFRMCIAEFLSIANISDRSVEPYIKHLSFCAFNRNRDTPIQISAYSTWLQTHIQPTFALAVNIGAPLFMLFKNPFA